MGSVVCRAEAFLFIGELAKLMERVVTDMLRCPWHAGMYRIFGCSPSDVCRGPPHADYMGAYGALGRAAEGRGAAGEQTSCTLCDRLARTEAEG